MCNIRWLGDLHIEGISYQDWWKKLEKLKRYAQKREITMISSLKHYMLARPDLFDMNGAIDTQELDAWTVRPKGSSRLVVAVLVRARGRLPV